MAAQANDFMAVGQQFWDSWTQFAQNAGKGQTPAWGDPAQVFSGMAPGFGNEASKLVDSLGEQGRRFLDFMQGTAARMGAGENLGSPDVAALFRRAMADGNPLQDALRTAAGEGARSFEQLARDVQPMLQQFGAEWSSWLGIPAFGYSREKQERLQSILKAQAEYQETTAAYNALLLKASQRGNEYFESKLAERSEPGRQLDSLKAVYDLWVDAAEEAYAEVALSPEFRGVYGAMVNAQMRLRQLLQKEVEQQAAGLGLPTRSELDGSHRKLHELQREMRELRRQIAALSKSGVARSEPAVAKAPTPAAAKPSTRKSSRVAKAKPAAVAAEAPIKKSTKARVASKKGA